MPINAHRVLDEPWIGCSVFVEEGKASLHSVQMKRPNVMDKGAVEKKEVAKLVWADMSE